MSEIIRKWQMLWLVCMLVPMAGFGSNAVWDGSTDTGFQNVNATWGVDDQWSYNGVDLFSFKSTDAAFFGGNGSVSASPSGNFTVTVSGTQTCVAVRQLQNGAGDFTLEGGTIITGAGGARADRGTFTVNSVLDGSTTTFQLNAPASGAVLVLGGSNTFDGVAQIRGSSGGTILLNNPGALGDNYTQFYNTGVTLDLNGLDISGKDMTVNAGQTGFLGNSGDSESTWAGNLTLATGASNIRAGGTDSAVEFAGVISGDGGVQVMDGGILRLSGANVHTGNTVVRPGGTLIINNAAALGTTDSITYIQDASTLDLNGFNVGSEEINMQKAYSRLVNEAVGAATVGGPVSLSAGGLEIGGSGDLTLSGAISGAGWFTKVGTGTLSFSATNPYVGPTSVNEGTLVGGSGAFSGSTKVSVAGGAGLVLQDVAVCNTSVMLSLDDTAALDLDYSGTQVITGLSLDGGTNWLAEGVYDAAQLSSINASGAYTGTGSLEVFVPDTLEINEGSLVLNWIGEYGASYTVESTTNLVSGAWVPVASNLVGVGQWLNYTGAVSDAAEFYRIIK